MKALILIFTALVLNGFATVDNADSIIGIWKNGSGKGHIQIYKNNNKYYGKIIWLRDVIDPSTGKPKVDRKNEDPNKRHNPLIGLIMLCRHFFIW
jgi:uncharacterized protein (DUF2147 family)